MNREDQSARTSLELKTLLDTTQLLIEPNELDFVLNNLLLIIMGKLLVGKAAVFLYQPYTDDYQIAKVKGRTGLVYGDMQELPFARLKTEASGFQLSECAVEDIPESIRKSGLELFINLKTSALHLGLVGLGRKMDGTLLDDHEREFLTGLCTISAAGIANSQLFGELRKINRELDKRVQQLDTLFDLSKEFSTTVELSQIVRIFKFALLGQLMVNNFFFLARRADRIELVAKNSIKGEPSASEIAALFALQEDVVMVTDALRNSVPFLEHNGIRVLGGIKIGPERVAIAGVGKKANGQEFTESDFGFLISLANLAVLSIQKTNLLEERIERKRLEEEVRLARTIQEGLFPQKLPVISGMEIAAENIPSQQVGGDYYDVLLQEGGRLYVAIADVTGKGIPASLIMANLQSMLHALTFDRRPIEETTGRLNEIIYKNTPADKFVTFFWGCLDVQSRQFCYVNAGHNPPFLLKSNAYEPEELTEGGLLLGAMPTIFPYESKTIQLEMDDVLVLFTDGVTEAEAADRSQYEESRLKERILKSRYKPANDLLKDIIGDVEVFSNGHFNDDVTVLVLKITGQA